MMPLFAPLAGMVKEEMEADCKHLHKRWMDMRKQHPEVKGEQELWVAFLKEYPVSVISHEIGRKRAQEDIDALLVAASAVSEAMSTEGNEATRKIAWLYVRDCKSGKFLHVPVSDVPTGGAVDLSTSNALSHRQRRVSYEFSARGKMSSTFVQVFAKAFDGEEQ